MRLFSLLPIVATITFSFYSVTAAPNTDPCSEATLQPKDAFALLLSKKQPTSTADVYSGLLSQHYEVDATYMRNTRTWFLAAEGAQSVTRLKVQFNLKNGAHHTWYLNSPGGCSGLAGRFANFGPGDVSAIKVFYWK